MPFPSIIGILKYHHFFLISGPLAIAIGFFLLRSISKHKGSRPPISLMLGPPIAFLLGGYHLWNTATQVRTAFQFRSLNMDTIESLEVTAMGRSNQKIESYNFIIKDNIRQALATLAAAEPISRSTADLINGYRVKINFADSSTIENSPDSAMYLSVYDQRSGSGPDAPMMIVVPHIGSVISPSHHGGYYTSADFMVWVRSHDK